MKNVKHPPVSSHKGADTLGAVRVAKPEGFTGTCNFCTNKANLEISGKQLRFQICNSCLNQIKEQTKNVKQD